MWIWLIEHIEYLVASTVIKRHCRNQKNQAEEYRGVQPHADAGFTSMV